MTTRTHTLAAAILAASGTVLSPAIAASTTDQPATLYTEQGVYQSSNDHQFTYVKTVTEHGATTVWFRDGVAYSFEDVLAFDHANPRPKIDDDLLQAVAKLDPDQPIALSVDLRNNPWPSVYRAIRDAHEPLIRARAQEMFQLQRPMFPDRPLNEAQEHAWAADMPRLRALIPPASQDRIDRIKAEIDALGNTMRDQTRDAVLPIVAGEQNAIADLVEALGGKVVARLLITSGMEVLLPAGRINELLNDDRVVRVYAAVDGEPELGVTVQSLGVHHWHAADIRGGVWDGALLDTGCQVNHPAFASGGLTFLQAPGVGITDSNGHGTSVAGIMTSRDATRTGIAPGISHFLVGLAGGTNTRDHGNWMVTTAAEKPEVINISFSLGGTSNDYHDHERWFDALILSSGTMVSKSTGNGGSGSQTITQPGQAYNLMGVANMTFQGTVTRADDVITNTSSRGPTRGGRRKPDITATGQGVFTTNSAWATASHFTSFGGTSAAAPHIGACYLLVTDIRGVDDPIAGKAVLLHTADARNDNGTLSNNADDFYVNGSHWSPTFGWGYVDMAEAIVNAPDVLIETLDLNPDTPTPRHRFYVGTMFQHEKATLVWNRHVGYNGTATPTVLRALTDLDLAAYRLSDGSAAAISARVLDNVEQISVPEDGQYVIRVGIAGNSLDPLVATERFALATEELFEERFPPVLDFQVTVTPLIRGRLSTVRAVMANTGDLTAYGARAVIASPLEVSNPNPLTVNFGPLAGEESGEAVWRIRPMLHAPATVGLGVSGQSNSFGFLFSEQRNFQLPVACIGDYNGDGRVDILDLLEFVPIWLNDLGGTGPLLEGDFNANAVVDLLDFTAFVDSWLVNVGQSCNP